MRHIVEPRSVRRGTTNSVSHSPGDIRRRRLLGRYGPPVIVGLVVIWICWSLRSTTDAVAYLDDSSMHEQMVRYAAASITAGRLPMTGWFPYLGLGSPQFLHYQNLGAMTTGLAGSLFGANVAFRWSLYLLLALWPIVIYASGRIFGLERSAAALAAAVSPLLMSIPGIGYEQKAYVWVGYGVWSQLWAAWALPLAWATTWRSMNDRRFLFPAAGCVVLTAALHFETGYLAFGAVVIFPFLVPSSFRARLVRAATVGVGALVASAWVTVPLIVYGRWAAINEVLSKTGLVRGYGARQDLPWLFTRQIFDAGRLPIVSIAVLVGIVVCVVRWSADTHGRPLCVLFVACLLLSFGPTTWGALSDIVPGHADIFFRRFQLGVQLAGIYIAGIGILAAARLVHKGSVHAVCGLLSKKRPRPSFRFISPGIVAVLLIVFFWPAWSQLSSYDGWNAAAIGAQRMAQRDLSPNLAPEIAYIKRHGGGRTYAGQPTNWGATFRVGAVPVFKYLESKDVDKVGYTLRTASLMTDPEYYFNDRNPGDYTLFGIRYLLLPAAMAPPVPAQQIMIRGNFGLWVIPANGYLDIVNTVGTISENSADVGTRSRSLLDSRMLSHHEDLNVSWPSTPAGQPTARRPTAGTRTDIAPGVVTGERADLARGQVIGTVDLSRRAVVLLSASYDPGWRVTVDGRVAPAEMLAPAVVGVVVGPGIHRVTFTYVGFEWYPELFVAAFLALSGLWFVSRRQSRFERGPREASTAIRTVHHWS